MDLIQADIDFIYAQLTLPGNLPLNPLDPTGLRDVSGFGNNRFHPTFGAADQFFVRLTTADYTHANKTGTFVYTFGAPTPLSYSPTATIDYATRGTMVVDASPRLISNLVVDQTNFTPLQIQDNPATTLGGRLSPVTGLMNPLPFSSYFTLFGQFFDHGLDFVKKGADGIVLVPLLPGDPLYVAGSPTNFMIASRTNTEMVNGVLQSRNTVSPLVDQSQSYGSSSSHLAFLREYLVTGGVTTSTGRLVSGDADGVGSAHSLATWSDIKANALKLGITLHDYNVKDIPQFRLNADGSIFLDASGHAFLMTTTAGSYVQDTSKAALATAGLTLVTIGHAFLDDIAHAANSALGGLGGASDLAVGSSAANLLNAHFIAGDGRINENLGLSAIHEIFHSEHNRLVQDLKTNFLTLDVNGVYHDAHGNVWSTEYIFQTAKFINEMEYQHLVFGEFARKLSPNINAFAAYNITLDAAISAEFAHAVYRFGHSMLTETVSMFGFDATSGLATGTDHSMGLIAAFLNPGAYTAATAGEVAIGMSRQVGNEIDELVTGALRNNLVGLPLDLATLNIVRGRDSGIPSLNHVREQLFAQTGMSTLAPYTSWDDFGAHLLHPQSLKNFIMAYSRDAILNSFGGAGGTSGAGTDWNALQLSDSATYAIALNAAAGVAINNTAFMLTNQNFWDIDLWLGGLAEAKVTNGMLGSTFDFVFATQMIHLQNADRFYYLDRLAGTNLLAEIEGQLLSDIVMRNTGVQHMYTDIFSVADSSVELGAHASAALGDLGNPYAARFSLLADTTTVVDANGVTGLLNHAGYVVGLNGAPPTFYGNPGNYLDARGVFNPNGTGNASETLGGTAGDDRINGGGGNDTIWADGGNDTLEGGTGNDFVHGGAGDDIITDTEGDDLLWGDAGNDNINAGNGADQVFGGLGNDILRGGLGADAIEGGPGNDIMYGDNGAVINGVMDPTGGDDVINGGAGDDTLYGGGGNDTMDGGVGNDILHGGIGNNALLGLDGNDQFIMDASGIGFNNALDGGLGIDTVDYSASIGVGINPLTLRHLGVTINLSNGGAAVVPVGVNVPDSFLSVERLIGSAWDDTLTGGAAVVTDAAGVPIINPITGLPTPMDFFIDGGAGNDLITGGNGNDTIIGGLGDDILVAGLGIDTASYATAAGGVTVNLATLVAQNTVNAGTDTLSGFENLTGSAFNDTLTGDAFNNTLEGGNGNDILVAGLGIDTASYAGAAVGVTVSLAIAGAQNTIGAGSDTLSGFENLTGSAFNDTLSGDAGNNTLEGGLGNDTLDGAGGIDTASYAGAGSTGDLGVIGVTVNLAASGVDTVNAGTDTFISIENLIGSAFNDTLSGDAGNNTLEGGLGNDTLNGAGGIDTASYAGAAVGVTVNLATLLAQNTIGAGFDTLISIENLTGSAFNDTLGGDVGNNTLDGGLGIDTASYALATAGVTVDLGNARAQNTIGAGTDTLIRIENLTGSAFADTLTGDAGNNTLDGGVGNDNLNGGAGVDILIGGKGNDTMNGGTGANFFMFGALFDFDTINGFDANPFKGQDLLNIAGTGITALNFGARVQITIVGSNTLVSIDTDGVGGVDSSITLVGVNGNNTNVITQADFVLA